MRKFLALAVCLMLLGSITVNGTLAFSEIGHTIKQAINSIFGEAEKDKTKLNIITSVMKRDKQGNLVVDEDNSQILIPLNQPDDFDWEAAKSDVTVGGRSYKLWTYGGVIDKFIFVKNSTATVTAEDAHHAYFRSAVSIRCSSRTVWNKLKINLNTADYQWSGWMEKDGWYTNVATYGDALAPGKTAPAMMFQVALDKSMTNEEMMTFGKDFRIKTNTVAIDAAITDSNGNPMKPTEALNIAAPIGSFQ